MTPPGSFLCCCIYVLFSPVYSDSDILSGGTLLHLDFEALTLYLSCSPWFFFGHSKDPSVQSRLIFSLLGIFFPFSSDNSPVQPDLLMTPTY